MSIGLVLTFNIMMFFISIIFSAVKSKKELNSFFLILSSFLTALYAIQRDFDYGDTLNYVNFYNYEHNYINFEPLFDWLARLFINLYPQDPVFFLFFCAFLTSSLLFLSYKKLLGLNSSYLAYWILLSTFSFHYILFEAVRQGMSIAFLLLGIAYLVKNKDWLKYYIFLFLAIGCHYSAIPFVFLPIFFFIRNKFSYFFIFIIIGILGKFILVKLGGFLGAGVISQKLEIYSEMTSESKTILVRNFMFICMAPFVYKIVKEKTYFNVYFLYVLLLAITLGIDEVNRRYLFIGPIFLLPVVWEYFSNKKNGVLLILIFTFLYFYLFLINYWSMYGILNYKPLSELI